MTQTPEQRRASQIAAANAANRKYPDRVRARRQAQYAVRTGRLVRPDECSRCGVACTPQASHDDYTRPLDVEWLCVRCHRDKDRIPACKRGHPFTPENTRWAPRRPRPVRQCRTCDGLRSSWRRGTNDE